MISARPVLDRLRDYVPGKSIEEIRSRTGLSRVVKLASNENPSGPSPKALEAVAQALSRVHLYPRGHAPDLLSAIATATGVGMDQIIVGNGSDEILNLVALAYLEAGTRAVSARETFSVYETATVTMGADFTAIPLREWRFDLDSMVQAARDPKTRVIFVCNPNNPTGTWIGASAMRGFLEQIPSRVLIVVDQAYWEYADLADYPAMTDWLEEFPNLLLTRTFSKVWGLAGLRVGYGLGHPSVIANLWKVKPPFNVNILAQEAARAALEDETHLKRSLAINDCGKRQLFEGLSALGLSFLPTQGNFIACHLGTRAQKIVAELENRGIIVRGLSSFGMPEWVRITVGLPDENELFLTQLQRVAKEIL